MPLSNQEVLDCLRSDDLIGIGMEAHALRRLLHPEGVVTYTLELPEALAAEADDRGATGLVLRGGRTLPQYLAALTDLRKRLPALAVGGLTATDVLRAGDDPAESIVRLRDAGLAWLGGWDAEVLDPAFRQSAASVEDWLRIHRLAHAAGLPTMATLTFGQGETHDQRATHLELLGNLQSDTGGFRAFTPATFQHAAAVDDATSVEYLRVLATSRLALSTIPHLGAHWPSQGVKVLQLGLRFGADDAGAAGDEPGASEEDLRRMIRDAGFEPVQRSSDHGTVFLR